MKARKGRLFVVSAPSGSGKTTLCQMLIQRLKGKRKLVRSVSLTTRKPRRDERKNTDYFFISQQEFLKRKRSGQLLEWAKVLGNFYGTPREFVESHLNRGDDVLLSIDVQGALKIKRKIRGAVFIFILPPSFQELDRRLRRRSTEDRREIARRLKLAKRELAHRSKYHYVVVNDKINQALVKLEEIIKLERRK